MITRRHLIHTLALSGASIAMASLFTPAQAGGSGQFVGLSTHTTVGTARIIEENGAYFVEFGDDFMHDQSPDPRVALGRDGYDPTTKLGELKARQGKQRYEIPADLNPAEFNEIWLWCDVADVPLGRAPLK